MRKSEITAFLLLPFLYRETYILLENVFEETQFLLFHSLTVFSRGRLLEKYSNNNGNIDIHWFWRRHTPIQNTWLSKSTLKYARYFDVDFDNNGLFLLLIYFRQVPSIYGKKSILIWEINFITKSITKGIEILEKRLFSFSIIVFSMKILIIHFIRKEAFAGEYFWFTPYK